MKNIVNTDRKISNNKTPEIVRNNIAIDLAINDMTTGQCAKKYGIAQQTICRWLRNDPAFVSDVERYRQNAVDEKIDALNRVILSNIDQQIQNTCQIHRRDGQARISAQQRAGQLAHAVQAAGIELMGRDKNINGKRQQERAHQHHCQTQKTVMCQFLVHSFSSLK